MAEEGSPDPRRETLPTFDEFATSMASFVNLVELAAALFALLFAIGVIDLALIIAEAALAGNITDPQVVIGLIDVGLLLLIIVEVYQTVVAYVRENDTRRIVRLVIYTGVIALVRKVIIFRTEEYTSYQDALSYTILTLGLVALLYVDRRTGKPAT
jgi:uncharacterized membrane protein (DUF373 family)